MEIKLYNDNVRSKGISASCWKTGEEVMKYRLFFNICMFLICAAFFTGCSTGAEQLTELDSVQTTQQNTEYSKDQNDGGKVTDKTGYEKDQETVTEGDDTKILVHVCGAVRAPGVYELTTGSRVFEAVRAAGGARDDGCSEAMNQARILVDGERVYLPTYEEAEQGVVTGEEPEVTGTEQKGKINLNTATKEELMTLPGIGESKAESILSFRKENGKFNSIEELMNIEGIKEGVFNKIKDMIIVTV